MHFALVKKETIPKPRSTIFFKGTPNNPELLLLKQGLRTPGSNKMHVQPAELSDGFYPTHCALPKPTKPASHSHTVLLLSFTVASRLHCL